jgi:hypothetical protein
VRAPSKRHPWRRPILLVARSARGHRTSHRENPRAQPSPSAQCLEPPSRAEPAIGGAPARAAPRARRALSAHDTRGTIETAKSGRHPQPRHNRPGLAHSGGSAGTQENLQSVEIRENDFTSGVAPRAHAGGIAGLAGVPGARRRRPRCRGAAGAGGDGASSDRCKVRRRASDYCADAGSALARATARRALAPSSAARIVFRGRCDRFGAHEAVRNVGTDQRRSVTSICESTGLARGNGQSRNATVADAQRRQYVSRCNCLGDSRAADAAKRRKRRCKSDSDAISNDAVSASGFVESGSREQ